MKSFNKINLSRFNRTIKTLALGAVVAMTCSCEDFLTIYPTDKVVLENYWKTKNDVENVVANSYRLMTHRSFMDRLIVWGELRGDNVIEGTYDAGKHGDIKNIMEANILPQNGYTSWSDLYAIINNCNIVLRFAPEVMAEDPDFTQGDLDVTRGEMLAMRALCHFYLVRTFRDIPLQKEAMVDDDQELYQKQATPIEALDFILQDLYEAEGLVMSSGSYPSMADNKGRITKDAVRAMIADALLWKAAFTQYAAGGSDEGCDQYYTECIAFCDSIINERNAYIKKYEEENPTQVNPYRGKVDDKYPLVHHPLDSKNASYLDAPYMEIFSDGNCLRESIFELQHSNDETLGNYEVPYFYGNDLAVGPLAASKFLAKETDNLYAKTDYRRVSFINVASETEAYPIIKYCYSTGTGTIDKPGYGISLLTSSTYSEKNDKRYYLPNRNWIVYRVSDVMLMKAEALALRNDTLTPGNKDLVNSFDLVKAVYYRSNPYNVKKADSLSYTIGNAESLQEVVLEERQRELAFEGKRWYDLVRKALRDGETGPMLDIMIGHKYESNQKAIRTKMASMDCLFFPIQEREIKTNPLLKQNPAYETTDVFEKN